MFYDRIIYVLFFTNRTFIQKVFESKNESNTLAGETRVEHATDGFGDRCSTIEPLPFANNSIKQFLKIVNKITEKNLYYMKKVVLYTDGACSGNPGKGGWCAILNYKGYEKIISGGEIETTNNRMELKAVIMGMEALNEPCEVEVYSDSAYVVNAVSERWIFAWQKNGWVKSDKKSVKNIDLWEKMLYNLSKHKVTFIKVKGHADNETNNRCDSIARSEILKL